MEFPAVQFLETAPKSRKKKKNSPSCVYVLHATFHQEISRLIRAVTVKNVPKSVMHVLVIKPVAFWKFLLPFSSSLLKLAVNYDPRRSVIQTHYQIL